MIKEIILVSSIATGAALPLHAQEQKEWKADNADLVIVGRFQTVAVKKRGASLWFEGVITTKEVLFGPPVSGKQLRYKWDCSCCRPSPDLDLMTKQDGIWFFEKRDNGYWTSAGQTCSDPGYRPYNERAEWREYLRTHRIPGPLKL